MGDWDEEMMRNFWEKKLIFSWKFDDEEEEEETVKTFVKIESDRER